MAWNPRQWWSHKMEELGKSGKGGGIGCERCMQSRVGGGIGCDRCMQSRGGGGVGCDRCMQSKGGFMIPSIKEVAEVTIDNLLHHERQHGSSQEEEDRLARARECTDLGVRAGLKAGSYACVASAIPTLVAVRTIPWAKYNLNYTAQALIISASTIAAYFITTEKSILACSRDASYARLEKQREAKGL